MKAQHWNNLQHSLDYAKTHIEQIARSELPIRTKQQRIDVQMVMLFEDVIEVLPKHAREALEECFLLYDRAWNDLSLPPSYVSLATPQSDSPSIAS